MTASDESISTTTRQRAQRPIRVGVSACLVGEAVGSDAGHERDPFLTDGLGRFVQWVPICPKLECGLSVPREAMHLLPSTDPSRLMPVTTSVDPPDRMRQAIERTLRALASGNLSGYVLEKDSPGYAMARAKVDETGEAPECVGRAVLAAALLGAFPHLPVEEAGRLSDARVRENFVARVFAYRRLQDLFEPGWRVGDLVRFHAAHKLMLMSHAPDAYRTLGRLVARAQEVPAPEVEHCYRETFMRTLTTIATPGRHVNVLQHMAGYFKTRLDKASKAELGRTIDDYRRGLVPLIVPVTLLERHVRTHAVAYLSQQVYLDPHAKELMLRHHV